MSDVVTSDVANPYPAGTPQAFAFDATQGGTNPAGATGSAGEVGVGETGTPVPDGYNTNIQRSEGIEETEIRIRKEAEYEKAFQLLVDAGVGIRNIKAAETEFRVASGIAPDDEISGTDLIIAVANGLPGKGDLDEVTGEIRTKPLISEKNLEEVLDRINTPTDEEFKDLEELTPRRRPDYNASSDVRYRDTLGYLRFFKNTFREDDEVLAALTRVLESSANHDLIEELGLEKFKTGDPRFQRGIPQRDLAPEDIMEAMSKPEPPGASDRFASRVEEELGPIGELASDTMARSRAEASGFGAGFQRVVGAASGIAAGGKTEKERHREEYARHPRGNLRTEGYVVGEGESKNLEELPFELRETEAIRRNERAEGLPSGEEEIPPPRGPQFHGGVGNQPQYQAGGRAAGFRGTTEPPPEYKDYITNEKFLEGISDTAVLDPALSHDALREWRSGRSGLGWDHPLRDPNGTLTPIQKENHSPDMDRKMGDSDLYEEGAVRNAWNQFMNDNIAIGKADSEALITRGLTPGSPLWNRAVSDLHWAASQEAKEILFYGDNIAQGGNIPEALLEGRTDATGAQVGRPARVKYYTDEQKPPETDRWARGEQLSNFGETPKGIFGQALHGMTSGVYSYLNEVNQTTKDMDKAYGTALDAADMWKALSVEDRKEIQFSAYMAQKYGEDTFFNVNPDESAFVNPLEKMDGDINDLVALEHWNQLVQEATLTAALGKPLTPNEIARKAIDDAKGELESYWGATSTELAKVINVELTDPSAIIHDARLVGKALMGHNPSEEDYRNLVGLIHSRERDSQIKKARQASEAVAQQKRNISAWQREQFRLVEDQLDDPSTYTGLDDPIAGANFVNIRPTTQGRIDRLHQLEPGGGVRPNESNGSGVLGGTSSTPALGGIEAQGIGGETINEDVGFSASGSMEEYFRKEHGEDIDANAMLEIFSQMNELLRSPIQVD